MRIFFVNRFFFPDHSATSQMLSDLAFGLADRGHDIAVIASRLDYDHPDVRLPSRETIRGVDVIRIATTGFGRHGLVGRTVDYLSFYVSAFWQLVRQTRRGDLIVAMTDPPLLSILATPAAWIRGARVGNWLQDIFPEVASALDMGRSRWSRWGLSLLRRARDATLRRAAINVVIGERMAEHVGRLGVPASRVVHIPNWADGQLVVPVDPGQNALRRAWGLDGAFVVGYSGNLGRAHDHETMFRAMIHLSRMTPVSVSEPRAEEEASTGARVPAAEILPQRPIAWLFVGSGARLKALQDDVRQRNLANVQFYPYQVRESLAESLSVPDVHLISLRPELEGLIVPSKYYGIAAAGRPAIFIGDTDGEIGRLLTRTQTGFVVAQGDDEGLARMILMLSREPDRVADYGRRARALLESSYDLRFALSAWERALSRVQ